MPGCAFYVSAAGPHLIEDPARLVNKHGVQETVVTIGDDVEGGADGE